MMIAKIVVLIEEQVKLRVSEEVHEQLSKMIIKGKLIQQRPPDLSKAKSHDGKSIRDILVENESFNSETLQCISVLDMEQSYSKIDKIEEESDDDGT